MVGKVKYAGGGEHRDGEEEDGVWNRVRYNSVLEECTRPTKDEFLGGRKHV
jgi:hypothetical protein